MDFLSYLLGGGLKASASASPSRSNPDEELASLKGDENPPIRVPNSGNPNPNWNRSTICSIILYSVLMAIPIASSRFSSIPMLHDRDISFGMFWDTILASPVIGFLTVGYMLLLTSLTKKWACVLTAIIVVVETLVEEEYGDSKKFFTLLCPLATIVILAHAIRREGNDPSHILKLIVAKFGAAGIDYALDRDFFFVTLSVGVLVSATITMWVRGDGLVKKNTIGRKIEDGLKMQVASQKS